VTHKQVSINDNGRVVLLIYVIKQQDWRGSVCVCWLAYLASPGPVRVLVGVGLQACGALANQVKSATSTHTQESASMLASQHVLVWHCGKDAIFSEEVGHQILFEHQGDTKCFFTYDQHTQTHTHTYTQTHTCTYVCARARTFIRCACVCAPQTDVDIDSATLVPQQHTGDLPLSLARSTR